MRLGLAIVAVLWAAVVIADVALIRTHVLEETYTGIATGAGVITGPLALQLWYGALAGKAHADRRQQRQLLSARTITGVRTIDLGALASVRRYELIGRFGGSTDELRLRDQHGVRLAVDSGDKAVIGAVREAVETADARSGGASSSGSWREEISLSCLTPPERLGETSPRMCRSHPQKPDDSRTTPDSPRDHRGGPALLCARLNPT
ncbi:hypothetical protein ACWDA7_02700 [Streptomyces sp. NPDC001156]